MMATYKCCQKQPRCWGSSKWLTLMRPHPSKADLLLDIIYSPLAQRPLATSSSATLPFPPRSCSCSQPRLMIRLLLRAMWPTSSPWHYPTLYQHQNPWLTIRLLSRQCNQPLTLWHCPVFLGTKTLGGINNHSTTIPTLKKLQPFLTVANNQTAIKVSDQHLTPWHYPTLPRHQNPWWYHQSQCHSHWEVAVTLNCGCWLDCYWGQCNQHHLDTTPLSLSTETCGGIIIKCNTTILTKELQSVSTAANNQTAIKVRVNVSWF